MAHCCTVLVHGVVATQLDNFIMCHVLQTDATRLVADTSAKVKAAIGIVVVDVLAHATAKCALHGELFVLFWDWDMLRVTAFWCLYSAMRG